MKQNKKTAGVRTRIRKGDEVVVVAGAKKDLSTPHRVLEVYPSEGRILVEGVNVVKRAYRKNTHPSFPNGGMHDKTLPIAISNVMLADPQTGEPTRIGVRYETTKEGKEVRVRYSKRTGNAFKD
jgi:large subunit ribosomal protein L24